MSSPTFSDDKPPPPQGSLLDVQFGEATPLLLHQTHDVDNHTPSWWRRASPSSGVVAILTVSCAAAALVMSLVVLMSQGFGNVDRSFFWGERIQPLTGDVVTTSSLSSGYGVGVVDDVKEEEIAAPALGAAAAAAAEGAGTASAGTRAPVFIHIPKTGGTTVEMSAAAHGVMLGMCASDYLPAIAGVSNCSRWHQPPLTPRATTIRDSFCITRNPFARLLSEYNYLFRDAATCEHFKTWTNEHVNALLRNKMLKCLEANPDHAACKERDFGDFGPPPFFEDCHLLPQTLYTSSCETVLAYERWDEEVVPWVQFVAGVSLTKTSAHSSAEAQTSKKVDVSCWKQMDPAIVQKFLQAYASDFKNFGYNHAVSRVELPPMRGFRKDVPNRIHSWKTQGRFGAPPNLLGEDQAQSCIDHNLYGKWRTYATEYKRRITA